MISSQGRVVLVTGAAKGFGLGTALAFAAEGAQTILACPRGSAGLDAVRTRFAAAGAPEPLILQADAASSDDTHSVFNAIKDKFGRLDAFICCAANAANVLRLEDLTERDFLGSMRTGAWSMVEFVLAAKKHLGRYPRHIVVMSSDGPDRFTPAYDFAAASEAAVKSLVRYLAYRLRGEDCRINILRSRTLQDEALDAAYGGEFRDFLRPLVPADWFVPVEDVANTALALCSGMFDAMTGQVLMADRGNSFTDGISLLCENRQELGL